MHLRRLDLNLLVALEALLSHRNVTSAAKSLHVSQPSLSGSLARLREHFNDPLLVQVGRRMQLTPLGEILIGPVHEALEKVEAAVSLRPDFDPATAQRRFSILASETVILTLLKDVLKQLAALAPRIKIELLSGDPHVAADRLTRREIDFAFLAERFATQEHPNVPVMNDPFISAVWEGNLYVKDKLTIDHYLSLGHVSTRYGYDRRLGFEQYSFEQLGLERRVEMTCASPTLLAPLIVGTQRIATIPFRLAQEQAKYLPIKLFEPPVSLPPLRILMQWHRTLEHDGATAWLRDMVLNLSDRYSIETESPP